VFRRDTIMNSMGGLLSLAGKRGAASIWGFLGVAREAVAKMILRLPVG
jgi:hypothetical protein